MNIHSASLTVDADLPQVDPSALAFGGRLVNISEQMSKLGTGFPFYVAADTWMTINKVHFRLGMLASLDSSTEMAISALGVFACRELVEYAAGSGVVDKSLFLQQVPESL